MKRITLLLSMFLFLVATSVSVSSCSKDEDNAKSCTELTQAYADAALAFNAEENATTCNALKDAINEMKAGCDNLTQDEIDGLDLVLAFLDCENL
ncbi:MAG: hypothetical protein K9H64_16915 [Bacteroidales bacterium]|nr:hypothetical protein [Bacteroidales bacterium]MCF8457632.1 hypothetical protein [Bacteroidales bacterium]